MKKCTVIDNNTGEILNDNFNILDNNDMSKNIKYARIVQAKKEFQEIQTEYLGNFVFFIFKNMNKLYEELGANDFVKFLYCGSYTNKYGYLMIDNNKEYIDKKKLQELLDISCNSFRRFFKKIISKNLIKYQDQKIIINIKYFWKGSKKTYNDFNNSKLKDYIRIYINSIRNLYIHTNKSNLKRISLIYRLIPYVNWKYNVLCNNVEETDENKINALTMKDIIIKLQYNIAHISRFKKDLFSQKCMGNYAFIEVKKENINNNGIIYINPLLFYRGSDVSSIKYLIAMFKIGLSKDYLN